MSDSPWSKDPDGQHLGDIASRLPLPIDTCRSTGRTVKTYLIRGVSLL